MEAMKTHLRQEARIPSSLFTAPEMRLIATYLPNTLKHKKTLKEAFGILLMCGHLRHMELLSLVPKHKLSRGSKRVSICHL